MSPRPSDNNTATTKLFFSRSYALKEWLVIALVVLGLVTALGWQAGQGRFDAMLYDQLIVAQQRPAHPDIVIVGIDEPSLAKIGRWPWPRSTHAELLDRITAANPRAVGMDLIFSEPERPLQAEAAPATMSPSGEVAAPATSVSSNDELLAAAIKRSGKVVLPVTLERLPSGRIIPSQPIQQLTGQVAGLGHVDLYLDSDGIVRSVFLNEGYQSEGVNTYWPQFAVALADVGGPHGPLPGLRNPVSMVENSAFLRDYWVGIPFSGPPDHYPTYSYVKVLRGEVPAQAFAGKYVLVGATAQGLADAFPTPVSGQSRSMPGIEVHANILAAILEGRSITPLGGFANAAACVCIVFVSLLALLLVQPRTALFITFALIILTLLLSAALVRYAGIWLAPSAALIGLIIGHPLWSWRRLEAAIGYLGDELDALEHEPHLLPETPHQETQRSLDVLGRRMLALKRAAQRVRDLRRFVSDNLDSLPDAVLVTTIDGHILIANRRAREYFVSLNNTQLDGSQLPYLLGVLKPQDTLKQFSWWDVTDPDKNDLRNEGVQARDARGRDMLVHCAPCANAAGETIGWIATLIDISPIRQAERTREETLRFLSHDMRAPQTSIIALLELQRTPEHALPLSELHARIEKFARKTLSLADQFVQLARAESQEYKMERHDLRDLIHDSIDETWAMAESKNMRIEFFPPEFELISEVDGDMMWRAFTNILTNAIKYSPAETTVRVGMHLNALSNEAIISFIDRGQGIPPLEQARLFRKFQRIHLPGQERQEGVGLGLAFVKIVLDKHQGRIEFTSNPGQGTEFRITLPLVLDHVNQQHSQMLSVATL